MKKHTGKEIREELGMDRETFYECMRKYSIKPTRDMGKRTRGKPLIFSAAQFKKFKMIQNCLAHDLPIPLIKEVVQSMSGTQKLELESPDGDSFLNLDITAMKGYRILDHKRKR